MDNQVSMPSASREKRQLSPTSTIEKEPPAKKSFNFGMENVGSASAPSVTHLATEHCTISTPESCDSIDMGLDSFYLAGPDHCPQPMPSISDIGPPEDLAALFGDYSRGSLPASITTKPPVFESDVADTYLNGI